MIEYDIPSFKDDSIDKNLKNAIKKFNPKTVLEVGVGLGSSTWAILDNAIDANVTVIDKFEFDPQPYRIQKIKKHMHFYNRAKKDGIIIDDVYDHYTIFCWVINRHSKPCTIIKQDIWNFISIEDNTYEFVFLDCQKHLPVLRKQLDFFESSKVICGTGYSNEHNKIDVDKFSENKNLFTDRDFWLIS